eukprot:5009389-Amphidinium_carterae.1
MDDNSDDIDSNDGANNGLSIELAGDRVRWTGGTAWILVHAATPSGYKLIANCGKAPKVALCCASISFNEFKTPALQVLLVQI